MANEMKSIHSQRIEPTNDLICQVMQGGFAIPFRYRFHEVWRKASAQQRFSELIEIRGGPT
jgi:hypothetical protein